jgi:predicted  nucleic acid-binding Zn-ribbon protein
MWAALQLRKQVTRLEQEAERLRTQGADAVAAFERKRERVEELVEALTTLNEQYNELAEQWSREEARKGHLQAENEAMQSRVIRLEVSSKSEVDSG